MATLVQRLNRMYEQQMYLPLAEELYEGSDFYNYGYWQSGIASQGAACDNLMDRLLDLAPDRRGRVLDAACGKGATTRFLGRFFQPEEIVGINISEKQLATCRLLAPRSSFLLMDATRLEFPDDSFDYVFCVEAAFHFHTTAAFLREAHRVLRPGGRLILCDILFRRIPLRGRFGAPRQNYVRGLPGYERQLAQAGFADVAVTDATAACSEGFFANLFDYMHRIRRERRISWPTHVVARAFFGTLRRSITHYVLASARKPPASATA